ncbi:unnamed protein product [Heligmosomoides polygyrus]|uniref:EB domain-containing protein n=1 Tax=Heligmosomoides polygyrus TaxID=6339 RepID=A0A183GRA1_HELPZ|nr:unnamed protein product [Heligmosomoides polygyrus]
MSVNMCLLPFSRCASDQHIVNEECVETECKSSQCISNSRCLNNTCGCGKGEKIEGNTCVRTSEEASSSRPAVASEDVCPVPSEHAFYEKGTTRLRYCSQIADDCPEGYGCQYSALVSAAHRLGINA